MLPASNRGTGTNTGFPDTCSTPSSSGSVNIPYPNIASASSASSFSSIVYVGMVNALNLNSSIPNTSGDEAGVLETNMSKAAYTTGNPIVYVEKVPAINLACPSSGNESNCTLAAVILAAVSVVSFTYASDDRGALSRGGVLVRRLDGDGVGVEIAVVTTDIARELRSALDSLGVEHPARFFFDLRGCRGGDLEGALDLASRFAPPGSVLAVVEDEEGDCEERRSTGGPWIGAEVEVVVDGGTASAAEVLAVALRDAAGATLRGERTYGKGRIEVVRGGMLVPAGEVLTPAGDRIEGVGIEPGEAS
ncbi:MAG: DUF4150 domain-containing protein [Polyangiaceae bacterium]|nr:DUF4150 domain-containing protein [Polyangiaceae bacterium]